MGLICRGGVSIDVGVRGVGVFGFAVTYHIANKLKGTGTVRVFDTSDGLMDQLRKTRTHPLHGKDFVLPPNVELVKGPTEIFEGADVIMLAVPGQYVRGTVREDKGHLRDGVVLLNLAKSLEMGTGHRMSQVVAEEVPKGLCYHYVQLSGGMFAEDVLKGFPLGASLACTDIRTAKKVARSLFSDRIHLQPTKDVIGVEYGGALKNLVAILAGISEGLGFSIGSDTFLISKAAGEIEAFAASRGAKRKTFSMDSPVWGNDMWMTCFGKSRNKAYGRLVGQGVPPMEALERMKKENKLVEGYYTLRTFHDIVGKDIDDYIIMKALYAMIYESKPPAQGIDEIMKKL